MLKKDVLPLEKHPFIETSLIFNHILMEWLRELKLLLVLKQEQLS